MAGEKGVDRPFNDDSSARGREGNWLGNWKRNFAVPGFPGGDKLLGFFPVCHTGRFATELAGQRARGVDKARATHPAFLALLEFAGPILLRVPGFTLRPMSAIEVDCQSGIIGLIALY